VTAQLFTSAEAEHGTRFINNAIARLQTRNFCNRQQKLLRKILAEYTESMPLDSFPVVQKINAGGFSQARPSYV
jgi:SOS-response transcriptional repressor LexA